MNTKNVSTQLACDYAKDSVDYYNQTGQIAPPFDPSKPKKCWFIKDPIPMATFPRFVQVKSLQLDDTNKPVMDSLGNAVVIDNIIPILECKRVNLPRPDDGNTHFGEGAAIELPDWPLKPLASNEVIRYGLDGNLQVVQYDKLELTGEDQLGRIEKVVTAIAAILGVKISS